LSDEPVHAARERFCDVGALRTAYRTPEGTIGYRCAAEPTGAFVAKGGAAEVSAAAVCLCNALLSTVDLPQVRHRGRVVEPPLLTLGDDLGFLEELATPRNYSAADAIALLERA
jgi:hypothetical protein